jgi:hypothetical protein
LATLTIVAVALPWAAAAGLRLARGMSLVMAAFVIALLLMAAPLLAEAIRRQETANDAMLQCPRVLALARGAERLYRFSLSSDEDLVYYLRRPVERIPEPLVGPWPERRERGREAVAKAIRSAPPGRVILLLETRCLRKYFDWHYPAGCARVPVSWSRRIVVLVNVEEPR